MAIPALPDWIPRNDLTRPSAEQLTRAENRQQSLTYAGPNEVIPVVWGEQVVGGPIIAGPVVSGSNLVWAVALSWAGALGIERIEDCRVGETIANYSAISDVNTGATANNSGISTRVFDGRQTAPHATLTNAIPGFTDDFHGIAYAILTCAVANFTSFPQVTWRIKGRRCFDPRKASWTATTLPINPNDVIDTGSGVVIAAGDNGELHTTDDFDTWTSRNAQFGSSEILSLGVADTNVIAAGEDGKVSTSPLSGATWTARTANVGTTKILNVLGRSTGNTILGGEGGVIAYSNDSGGTWARRDPTVMSGSDVLATFRHSAQQAIAGEDGKYSVSTLSNLADGSWVLHDAGFSSYKIRHLIQISDSPANVNPSTPLLALGDRGLAGITVNGTEFEYVDTGFGTANITYAYYADGHVIALADNGSIRFSVTGRQWFPVSADLPFHPVKMFYALGYVLIVSAAGECYRIEIEKLVSGEFTENPVLHLRDFVTNAEFGMGSELYGFEEAADIADSLYSGLPRTRAGLTVQDPMAEEDLLSLLAQYAEVLWSYENEGVRIIPDAPADEIYAIPVEQIREGSIKMYTVGLEQIPTLIRLMFTDRNDGGIWFSRPAVAAVPEHTIAGAPTTPSSVPLPGVFNRVEAERRVYQRLQRLQTPGRIEWQMLATGMKYQAGDVVRLPDVRGLQNVAVRITSHPSLVSPMIYQMGGEIYRASQYPEGAEGIAVPTGAIMIYRNPGAAPAGWEFVNTGNRLIKEGVPGVAGSLSNVSYTFSTTPAGGHTGTRDTTKPWYNITQNPGWPWGPLAYVNNPSGSPEVGDHTHSYNVNLPVLSLVSPRPFRFVRRVDLPGLLAPGLTCFAAQNIASEHMQEVRTGLNGHVIGSDGTDLVLPPPGQNYALSGNNHMHSNLTGRGRVPDLIQVTAYMGVAAGAHTHYIAAGGSAQLRAIALSMFESTGDAALPEGSIVGWEGSVAPAGWAFCDGNNGTVDMSDRFIYITGVENAGEHRGSVNQYTLYSDGITSAAGAHEHVVTQVTSEFEADYRPNFAPYHNSTEGNHVHNLSPSTPGKTETLDDVVRYQLRFIQYIGD